MVVNFAKKKTLIGIKILFSGGDLKFVSPLRGISSKTTHYLDLLNLNTIKGTAFLTPKRYDQHLPPPPPFFMAVPLRENYFW